jgi:cytochrome c-type biogenesis protein CcmH/NrfG
MTRRFALAALLAFAVHGDGEEGSGPGDPPVPRRSRSRLAWVRRSPRWVWWIIGLSVGALVYFSRPRQGPGLGPGFWSFLVLLCGVIGLLIVLMLLVLVRPRHRRVTSALRLARSGHVDAAISQLQGLIESRGPTAQHSSALGDCYLLLEQWQQAYIQYLDAERLDGRRGRYLAKQGFALWKLNRAAEAATLLATARKLEPLNPSHAWTSCLILIDLGRHDEAREELRMAEKLLNKGLPLDPSRRAAIESSIDVCRKRLREAAGDRPEASSEAP